MKKPLLFLCFALLTHGAFAQKKNPDSLKHLLSRATEDSVRINLIHQIMRQYSNANWDSVLRYGNKEMDIALRQNNEALIAEANGDLSKAYYAKGNYPKALELSFKNLKFAESVNNREKLPDILNNIGSVYIGQQNYGKAKQYYLRARKMALELKDKQYSSFTAANLANVYEKLNQLDSAQYYANIMLTQPAVGYNIANTYVILGDVELKRGQNKLAAAYFNLAYKKSEELGSLRDLSSVSVRIANYYQQLNKRDSAVYFAYRGMVYGRKAGYNKGVYESTELLFKLYDSAGRSDSAFKYLKLSSAIKDSLYNVARFREIDAINAAEEQRLQEIAAARKSYQKKMGFTLLGLGLALLTFGAVLLYRNSQIKKKAYETLEQQKRETESQKDLAEQALQQLQVTQAQLIQSEKMASLGELTAGIAHEIQNPLNFINNFSEVNTELLDELEIEINRGDLEEAKGILSDLKQNEERVGHHGKRADAIVKGMLQHSRSSAGTKELSVVNALVDEAMKLAFHGIRAKDNTFNAELLTHFAEDLPLVNLMPQDMTRVFLNLFNNAFYAVTERGKRESSDYRPVVTAETSLANNKLQILVKDNGTGIPEGIVDKIMQPFFTTKPTGEGTGLGLSLSYDIVKAHGGEITVRNLDGGGTAFLISLPL